MTSDVCNELIEQQEYTKLMVNFIQLHKQSLMINISLLKYTTYTLHITLTLLGIKINCADKKYFLYFIKQNF